MKQFHEVSRFDRMEVNKNQKSKSSDSEKLQQLWEKLQDLSEVQDQSRNEQLPMFCDDNSVMSKHSQNDSFFQTAGILEDYENGTDQQQPHHFTITEGKSDENRRWRQNEKSEKISNDWNDSIYSPLREVRLEKMQSKEAEKLQNKNMKFQGFEMGKQSSVDHNSKQKGREQKKLLSNEIERVGELSEINEINEKLLSDNKKLFDECIKLRIQLLYEQSRTGNSNRVQTKFQTSQMTQKLYKQQKQLLKQRQYELKQHKQQLSHLKSLQSHHKSLLSQQELDINRQKHKIMDLEKQNIALKETIRQMETKHSQQQLTTHEILVMKETQIKKQLQLELQTKYQADIMELNTKLKTTQKQIQNANQKLSQAHLKIFQLQAKLKQQKHIVKSLENQIQQYKSCISNQQGVVKLNGQKIQYITDQGCEKGSRATSVKSTSISCSSTINSKAQFSTNQNPQLLSNQFGKFSQFARNQSQTLYLEGVVKDKERQITNMKIVHESEVKKYKSLIQQLQLQLQLHPNSIQSLHTMENKNSISSDF